MVQKTSSTRKVDIKTGWRVIDAKGMVLGRLATDIVGILCGKDKPYYTKNMVSGDKVVVINAKQIVVSGNKEKDKIYIRHSGYIGGLKEESYHNLQKRLPGEVLRKAIIGMLPKNTLRKTMIANLYIYPDESHPHGGQVKN